MVESLSCSQWRAPDIVKKTWTCTEKQDSETNSSTGADVELDQLGGLERAMADVKSLGVEFSAIQDTIFGLVAGEFDVT